MTTEKELFDKYQAELAALKLENSIRDELPEAYRESALVSHPSFNFNSIKMWSDFRTEKTLADALEIVRLYSGNIVTGEHWKDGCVSCWPAEVNSCIKKEGAIMDGSHEVEISVCGGNGYGPTVEVSFWTRLAGRLVEIHLPVSDAWKLVPSVRTNYNNSGELSSCDITWPGERSVFDKFRTFWSQKPSYSGSYYFAEWRSFENWAEAQAKKTKQA
jgi:hypothetical protein